VANRTKLTPHAREKFLAHLSKTANVTESAKVIGMSRQGVYDARDTDPSFRRAWDQAVEIATDTLEQEARRRALDGWDEPVFYRGEEIGRVRQYSDRMLELLLKANRPRKFVERHEVTGKDGEPMAPFVTVYLPTKGSLNGHHSHNGDSAAAEAGTRSGL
jgi:hypothetical protein